MKPLLFSTVIGGKKATFTPTSLPDMLFWYKADAITTLNDGDAVASWADSSPNGNTIVQTDADKKPLFKTNILNGKPGILYDAAGDCLQKAGLNLTAYSNLTIYAVFTAAAGAVSIICEFGNSGSTLNGFSLFRDAANKIQFITTDGSVNAGFLTTGTVTTTPAIIADTYDRSLSTNEATGYINGTSAGARNYNGDSAGAFGTLNLNVGGRNNGASLPLNGYLFELIGFGSAHDATALANMTTYLNTRWAVFSPGVNDYADNAYTTVVNRSDVGTFVQTSPGARLVYQTDAETAYIDSYNNIYATYPGFADIGVRIDGVDKVAAAPGAGGSVPITVDLGVGANKTVEFIAGLQSGATAAAKTGTYVCGVTFNKSAIKLSPDSSPRMIIYGDSLAAGGNCDNPSLEGWGQLVRNDYTGSVLLEARGFRSLYEDGATAGARTTFAAFLATLNPSILWIAIGTNDYGLEKWSSADFGTAYADMLDKLHASMPSLVIYAQTPIDRTSEAELHAGWGTLGDYRTQIGTAVSTRTAYTTLVDGSAWTIELDDGVHPTVAGHAAYAAAVKTVLGL